MLIYFNKYMMTDYEYWSGRMDPIEIVLTMI